MIIIIELTRFTDALNEVTNQAAAAIDSDVNSS